MKEVFNGVRLPAWVLPHNPSPLAPINSLYNKESIGSDVHPELNVRLYPLPFSSRDK